MGNYHIFIQLWHCCCVCLFYLRLGSGKTFPRLPTSLTIFASCFENQFFIYWTTAFSDKTELWSPLTLPKVEVKSLEHIIEFVNIPIN